MKRLQFLLITLLISSTLSAKEYHVAKTGKDSNLGTAEKPFLSIQATADVAQPGDVITVHEGIYREWVKPPRGGNSHAERIVFQAAEGEKVEIKGSEIITGWEKLTGTVWRVSIPNSFFGEYNPYKDLIHGDWFNPLGRIHHTGEVYLNGKSLWEMALLEDVLHPKPKTDRFDPEGSTYTWFCESNDENTFIYANFQGANPNNELVEINVRKSCFYPEKTGVNFITVSGFRMSQAATQWAPPTAEQIGLIGTNWSKGWIIENNSISDSKCSGITLGKHGDEFDNTSENSAEGYVETIHRAIKKGWSKENIGSHIVRNNTIFNCEQTGICGSLGAIFSTIENNNIYNIWTKRQFTGAEMGGIKIHASIDMLIKNNRLANCGRGLWLDWMAQGTRVTGNLLYNNTTDDLFMEVNHGPFIIENNLFLSELSLRDWSEGGAYVHNLFAGNIEVRPQSRLTPYHLPHSTELAGLKETRCGDNRFFNNIFVGGVPENQGRFSGLNGYANTEFFPVFANGNVYLNGAQPFPGEGIFLELEANPKINVLNEAGKVTLRFDFDKKINNLKTSTITTKMLGKAIVPNLPFENRDGKPVKIDSDYFGTKRKTGNPTAGAFENPGKGENRMVVW
ncbi:MAG: right-handed parallel beta-helix repeat-containing protein [Mariniphaga sp.]|nr:right-handed parallel beta-helix repeat-containing protein [Mariniphaga sp.]